jgi:hypothetical protein
VAKVTVIKKRYKLAHFGLYRQSVGGDQAIIIRRKVGEPTDYQHENSRLVARQREYMSLASQHYAHLNPAQKATLRHKFEEVEYQKARGPTDTKLLTGRELFIAKDIRELRATGQQLIFPYALCIILVNENYVPLEGELWLRYWYQDHWIDCKKELLDKGNWLFSEVPRVYPLYWVYGEAPGLIDLNAATSKMGADTIQFYHYHILYRDGWLWQWGGEIHHGYVPPTPVSLFSGATSIQFFMRLYPPPYTTTLRLGLRKYINWNTPGDWIVYKDYQISATDIWPLQFSDILYWPEPLPEGYTHFHFAFLEEVPDDIWFASWWREPGYIGGPWYIY